ncbi:hypothetical protein B1R32_104134 [Abditibacterium utsteinense]|uniref:Uncharacterized protein n=1 Tax=Abditibacterium utsteinense TaxID=1960156 RepID=A0A2S8SV22_9BACT|nr:hypothetical protein [Abditibacterium utsteinense]PQV64640.1 hypothetical protein B1R32_104134 [Abditibacterium utsteinense]
MNQLNTQLTKNDWTLLVSLPKNDLDLAKAALNGGAQGLKVHINIEHFASGTRFGTLSQERAILERITELAREFGASVGVVPGTLENFASPEEFRELAQIGIDYFDAYPADAPAWALSQTELDVMMAAFHGGDLDEFAGLEKLGMTLCEASILHHDDYGKALSALDLMKYRALSQKIKAPIIVPSQKKIEPHDLPALRETGAKGLLIGAIVTGRDAASLETATRAFSGR